MTANDKLNFEKMMVIFVNGMVQYPHDVERMKAGYEMFYKFIDSISARECSAIVTQMSSIEQGGIIKGGNFNKTKN